MIYILIIFAALLAIIAFALFVLFVLAVWELCRLNPKQRLQLFKEINEKKLERLEKQRSELLRQIEGIEERVTK